MKPREEIEAELLAFVEQHALPGAFLETARSFYLPLAAEIQVWREDSSTLLLGINGAQGTGKSTLAEFLELVTAAMYGWRCAVLSIDDFYLTRAERQQLGKDVHPLLVTRGVPGTHDTELLARTLVALRELGEGESLSLPRFDKSTDDRAPAADWPRVLGPLDLVILEGWCVGSAAGDPAELRTPVNALEGDEDADRAWRSWVEQRLSEDYEPLFGMLDRLVLLAAPSWDAVYRWRLEQEQKLADKTGGLGSGIMSADEVARFIQHYERITRRNLATIPAKADAVLVLGEDHAVIDRA